MKEIQLTKGRFAMVDDDDYPWASQFKWQANFTGQRWYARRSFRAAGRQFHIYLHRVLMDVGDPSIEVDHANGNGLDCQRRNMRVATKSQNRANQGIRLSNKSGFKGVAQTGARTWTAMAGGKSLGIFDNPRDAARAYDAAAEQIYGAFAVTNADLLRV